MIKDKRTTVYVAYDGTEFLDRKEAFEYDKSAAKRRLGTLLSHGNVRLVNTEGNELDSMPECWYSPIGNGYDMSCWMRFADKGALVDFLEIVHEHYARAPIDLTLVLREQRIQLADIGLAADTNAIDRYIDRWLLLSYNEYDNIVFVDDTLEHQVLIHDKLKHIASE